ncbi:aldo/keto reductase [Candidatus Saccharibacteria bacterium]|nr:aldo/keto reductase [Candidatus Saccharibacteria bacterium]
MNIPTKKLKSGFELPVYGMGLWRYSYLQGIDETEDDQEIAAIQDAINKGITHFDTAEKYGQGHSEEILGKAIKGYDRSKLLIATKVAGENQNYDDLNRSFEASLKRIGTDYIDLYLLHSYPRPGIPIQDTMKALDNLVDQGAIKNIGACNLTPNRFKEAQKYTKNKLVCNQVHYNVQYREIEDKGVLDFCQKEDILLVAWRPVQYGKIKEAKLLTELAEKYNKTPMQVAFNWLISQRNVVTISKTNSIAHIDENLGSIGWSLSDEDIEKIRKEFPDQKLASDAVPLDYEADCKP